MISHGSNQAQEPYLHLRPHSKENGTCESKETKKGEKQTQSQKVKEKYNMSFSVIHIHGKQDSVYLCWTSRMNWETNTRWHTHTSQSVPTSLKQLEGF